ncbi:hypothetical protein ACLB2K_051709 [Fragaria x ananassa]
MWISLDSINSSPDRLDLELLCSRGARRSSLSSGRLPASNRWLRLCHVVPKVAVMLDYEKELQRERKEAKEENLAETSNGILLTVNKWMGNHSSSAPLICDTITKSKREA